MFDGNRFVFVVKCCSLPLFLLVNLILACYLLLNWTLPIPHNSPELMVLSMSARIGHPIEEALLSILRIPLVASYERIFLIMASNGSV